MATGDGIRKYIWAFVVLNVSAYYMSITIILSKYSPILNHIQKSLGSQNSSQTEFLCK